MKPKATEKVTLSPRESTKITGFGITQTYSLLKDGSMPNIKVGKKFYIPVNALHAWLDSCGGKVAA